MTMTSDKQEGSETAVVTQNTSEMKPSHYVGIGASAGGLEAIQAFFKALPKGSNPAYIVVQHLSPDYKSLMVELLGKITDIPVQRAEEGMEVLADHIYLIPPKKNLKIFHGKLLLDDQVRDDRTINLPIDIFLTSLAEDCGAKSIAIILSGAGSDGTKGCRAIKEIGGMVMVQDEASAKFNAMPRSVIGGGLPDFILPPSDMPKQLLAYCNHPYTRESRQHELLDDKTGITRIFSLLREKSKIDFTFYKPSTIVRRIERRMTLNQTDSLQEYVRFLEGHPKEQDTLYKEMLIGVTNFFRDPELFDLLTGNWLPDLLEGFWGDEFRIWVAGCSSGQEAYTYAIICREIMAQRNIHRNVKIFATDVDQSAIAYASAGIYPESIAADIPAELLSKYFIKQGDDYRVIRQIREMVVFARHNLINDPPFTNIELVSCRNLLIYLQPILQQKVFEGFNFSLGLGKLLVLGSSESLGDSESLFETKNSRWKIYQSKGHKKSTFHSDRLTATNNYRSPVLHRPSESPSLQQAYEEERILGRFVEILANDQVPFAMIIDESMNLIYVIGDGHRYLNPPSGKVVNEITRIVNKDLAIPLSTGLSKALVSNTEVNFTNVRIKDGQERTNVNVKIKSLPDQRGKGRLAAVFISESGTIPFQKISNEASNSDTYDLSREAEQRIRDLDQELQFTRENLQASIEELETSNEELQATNEELLASNEELQSTNEELQSVNEELFTVNAEHQNKITELTELNNDLDNFVNSTAIISVFLDENLDIRRFTSNADHVFNILPPDVGRPFEHISNKLNTDNILGLVHDVNDNGKDISLEVVSQDNTWYQLHIRPYMVSNRVQSGVVIVLNDIDEIKTLQNELLVSKQRYELAQSFARIGIWERDLRDDSLVWSENFEPMFGVEKGSFANEYSDFIRRIHPDDRVVIQNEIENSINNKTTCNVEYRVLWPDKKSVVWMRDTSQVEYDEYNNPIKMTGLVQEINDRRIAEEALKYNAELLNNILATAPSGIGLICDQIIEWVNPKIEEITGYKESELMGNCISMLYPNEHEYNKVSSGMYEVITNDRDGSLRSQWKTKSGEVIGVLISIRHMSGSGDYDGVIFTVMRMDTLYDLNNMCPLDEGLCPVDNARAISLKLEKE